MELKNFFHLFWAWDDEKEEKWLCDMARQGWHMKKVNPFSIYTMVHGEPREMAYRLDFFIDHKNKDNFLQLFKDAGWEYVGASGSWQYFRKPVNHGETAEIFTDNHSKIHKYGQLLNILVIFSAIYPMILIRLARAEGLFYQVAAFFAFLIIILFIVAILKLIHRINQLKQKG